MLNYIIYTLMSNFVNESNCMEQKKEERDIVSYNSVISDNTYLIYDQSLGSLNHIIIPDINETTKILSVNVLDKQKNAYAKQKEINKTIDHIISSINDIELSHKQLPQTHGQFFDVFAWANQKIGGIHINLDNFQASFHNKYSLGGPNVFSVPYNGTTDYRGTQVCSKPGTVYGACGYSVSYSGRTNYSGNISATCTKTHHQCQCSELRDLALAYTKLVERYKELESLNSSLLNLKKYAEDASKKLTTLDELISEPLNNYSTVSEEMKKYMLCAQTVVALQKSMMANREKLAKAAAQEHEKSYQVLKEVKNEAMEREKELHQKLEEDREKYENLSKSFIDRLDSNNREYFQKIEEAKNNLIEKYENRIESLRKEKEQTIIKYYENDNKFIALQSSQENYKMTLIQLLIKYHNAKHPSNKELHSQIEELRRNHRTMGIEEVSSIVNSYLLSE